MRGHRTNLTVRLNPRLDSKLKRRHCEKNFEIFETPKMGGDSSSNKGRESAIEALVDMDPRGPAFRVNRIMVSGELLLF